jgi:glycosyltransferase involved in cell wall biosynthesis
VQVELSAPESAEPTAAADAEREGPSESVSDAFDEEPRISTDERVPVTVAMPTAGRSPWLRDAIESVLAQTVPPAAFIVVSDGGGENVRRAVEPYRDHVSLVEIPPSGQAAAMNRALRDVKTEFVAWLDDDDYFLPRKLELQVEDLLAHPDAAFGVTEHYVVSPEDEILEWRPVVSFDPGQVFRLLLGGSFFLGPTAMVRTAHYRALGPDPYEADLRRAADYPMWFELAARGDVRVLPLALSAIRRHAGNQITRERVALMRESARRTLSRAIARWPLETFFPGIAEAGTPEEERETHAVALLERAGHLLRVGLVDEALTDLRAGLEIRPEDGRLRHFYALASMTPARRSKPPAAPARRRRRWRAG